MKKWGKLLAFFCCVLFLSAGVISCGEAQEETEITASDLEDGDEDTVKIGLSFDSFVIERWLRDLSLIHI